MPKICPTCERRYDDDVSFCPSHGTTLRVEAADRNDLVGTVIADRYLVTDKLGEGGMGCVYLAQHVRLPQQAAIKVLHPSMVHDTASLGRFNAEAANACRISSQYVATVYDFGETEGGQVYLAMEYVPGETLSKLLRSGGAIEARRAVALISQVAEGLDAAHALGIVHRDLKPDNIMVTRDATGGERAKVVDFGIAKQAGSGAAQKGLTQTGMVVGTAEYMSPEQIVGGAVDHRSDVYALGLVAFAMLTGGALPFTAATREQAMVMRLTNAPKPLAEVRPDVAWPHGLQGAFDRALAGAPEDRFSSAGELAAALADAVEKRGLEDRGPAVVVAAKPTPVAQRVVRARSGRARWLAAATGTVLVLALAAFEARRLPIPGLPIPGLDGAGAASALGDPKPAISSVAVLPFRNISRDSADEYISDGIAEELLNALAKIPGLQVAERSSSFAFKESAASLTQIARRLKVHAVIDGSVQRAGDQLRVTARLVDTRTDSTRWSDRYDRDAKEVFSLQDEISAAVVGALQVAPGASAAKRYRPNPTAYHLYLRGRFLLNHGERDDIQRAIALFTQATTEDSLFADPYAAAASAWSQLADVYVSPTEAYPKAEALAQQALARDEGNAEAHANLGYVLMVLRWDWAGAQREFERALALNPNDATTHSWYAGYWWSRGDLQRALREAQEAVRLDPLSAYYTHELASHWMGLGQADSAIAAYERAEAVAPGYVYGGSYGSDAYRAKGNYAKALALDSAAARDVGRPTEGLVQSLVALGRRPEAERTFRDMQARAAHEYVLPEGIAVAALALGQRDVALAWLKRGVDAHSTWAPWAVQLSAMQPLRADPRYQALVRRMGLEVPR